MHVQRSSLQNVNATFDELIRDRSHWSWLHFTSTYHLCGVCLTHFDSNELINENVCKAIKKLYKLKVYPAILCVSHFHSLARYIPYGSSHYYRRPDNYSNAWHKLLWLHIYLLDKIFMSCGCETWFYLQWHVSIWTTENILSSTQSLLDKYLQYTNELEKLHLPSQLLLYARVLLCIYSNNLSST